MGLDRVREVLVVLGRVISVDDHHNCFMALMAETKWYDMNFSSYKLRLILVYWIVIAPSLKRKACWTIYKLSWKS